MTESTDKTSPGKGAKTKKERWFRKIPARQILLIGGAFIVGFIVFGAIAIQVWEYSNSVAFCANACHDVHPEEIPAYQDSYHANVQCTECHMGRVGTIRNILLKASHARHLPEVIFDAYDRPLESESLRPANESCELCHWPPAFHGDTVREVTRYLPDEQNTQERTYLILKTGAGTRESGLGYGIHWHITNPVEYIATDEHKEKIPWVRATLPDGRTVEYQDVTNPLTTEEIGEYEKKEMDCVDCHNRMGHPFPSPGDLIHKAMDEGRLSADLPYVKREMLNLLKADYESRDEALEAVNSVKEQYKATYPEVAAAYPEEIGQAQHLAEQLVNRLVFEEPGVTWESFPNHNKHKDFAGCFRCHDGKHLSAEGESIRLHCNICHSIPETVQGDTRPPQMPLTYIQEPESHLETNFMADHRFQANSVCEQCHGKIAFGDDDSSFCANSACHGRAWPEVELDAAFPHPFELKGKHAEVWCHECHNGVREPEYVCANCHESPPAHFGDSCEDCHTPAGFEGADWGDFQHPMALENAHAQAECADCHVEGRELTGACSDCHQPPDAHYGPNCEDCHTPTSFKEARLPAEMHPVELVGKHQAAACEGCHGDDKVTDPFVCGNCHESPENHLPGECDICHTPDGFAASAAFLVDLSPQISHELEGREDCYQCHDPGGEIKPAPSNHVDYVNEHCVLCHKPES
ncbi:MAG: NapC/NirT family cytochrome c [Anaerolineae bacterium]